MNARGFDLIWRQADRIWCRVIAVNARGFDLIWRQADRIWCGVIAVNARGFDLICPETPSPRDREGLALIA